MNLENTETIVDERNADFLWHSNEALRNELDKKKKELQKMEMKWHDCYWNKR